MKNDDTRNIKILNPKNQLELYGFEDYFHSFVKLFKKTFQKIVVRLGWDTKVTWAQTLCTHLMNCLNLEIKVHN